MSLPLTTVTPASSASLNTVRIVFSDAGSGSLPTFQPRYFAIASAVASVGQKATPRLTIKRNTSTSPPLPCSIVSTPPSAARRIPSLVVASATTGQPAERAVSTISFTSSTENVAAPPFFGSQLSQ